MEDPAELEFLRDAECFLIFWGVLRNLLLNAGVVYPLWVIFPILSVYLFIYMPYVLIFPST